MYGKFISIYGYGRLNGPILEAFMAMMSFVVLDSTVIDISLRYYARPSSQSSLQKKFLYFFFLCIGVNHYCHSFSFGFFPLY